jgi:hypothetical protein
MNPHDGQELLPCRAVASAAGQVWELELRQIRLQLQLQAVLQMQDQALLLTGQVLANFVIEFLRVVDPH